MKKRVAFISIMLAPYRVTFYNKLFNNPDNEFCLFHGVKQVEDGRPHYDQDVPFANVPYTYHSFRIGPLELFFHKKLNKRVKEFKPDTIIMYGNPGVISNILLMRWAKRRRIKVILWVCSWDKGINGIYKKLKSQISKYYFSQADSFIAYGSNAKSFLMNYGITEDKIQIAFNGIEIDGLLNNQSEILNEAESIRQKNAKSDDIVFSYVGGLIESKKILQLIEQFNILNQKYPNTKLWIIGDGTLKSIVQSRLAELENDNIVYFGRIIDGVDKYFAASDCLVLPGAGGLALNQAMFWTKPCICSVADGTEEDLIFDGITGFYFERENWSDLHNAMEKIILTPAEERKKMGQNGKEIILNKSNVNRMVETFNETIKNA